MREVGKQAGVSHVTVSRVLRGEQSVAAGTRERVLAAVAELGYRVNPLVRAYAERMRGGAGAAGSHGAANLGWIAAASSVERDGVFAWLRPYKAAAFARAAELGYAITDLSRQHSAMGAAAFERMLQARGIGGLIVADFAMVELVKADLEGYAVVAIGLGHLQAPFNRIVPDYPHDLRMAFDQLLELGYRRIGLHQTPFQMLLTEGGQEATYRLMQQRLPEADRLPVFREPSLKQDHQRQVARLVKWVRAEGVQVLLLNHARLANELQVAGLLVPQELGIVHLGHGEGPSSALSGIQYPVDHYGKAAVDLLSAELLRNERGLPPFPMKISLVGGWRAGRTLRRLAGGAVATAAKAAGRMPSLDWYIREYAGGLG